MDGLGLTDALTDQSATRQNTEGTAPGGALGKDEFLQLLVTQLKYQDPMNPMDGQEFAAQLAQFSSVEQLVNISDVLAENGQMNGVLAQSINSGVAAGLIGKNVEAAGNAITWNGGDPAEMRFELESSAQEVTITVTNEAGVVMREYALGGHAGGPNAFEWDGKTSHGAAAAPGTYSFHVAATDAAGEAVEAETFSYGKVDRISFGQDGVRLWLGEHSIAMSDVSSVE